MGEMLDLDALAAEAEGGEPFYFKFSGDEYELAPHVDVRAVACLAANDLYGALHCMLGEEQWERMQRAEATFTDGQFKSLVEAYAAHSGATLGESKASTDSSKSTVRPSKRTSGGSTKSGYRK